MMKRNDLSEQRSKAEGQVYIDIVSNGSVANSIRKKLKGVPELHRECCIYRVPEKLRRNYEEAYTPRVVSVGPYHHKTTKNLLAMEDQKLRYALTFLNQHQTLHLEDCIEYIKKREAEVRCRYDEHIAMESDAFTEMILVDSIFIIQLFLLYYNPPWKYPTDPQWEDSTDPILKKPWLVNDVRRDMTLLENQLPLFVIQGIYNLAFGSHQQHTPSLLELAYRFFRPSMKKDEYPEIKQEAEVQHFLDAVRLLFLPSQRKAANEDQEEIEVIPTATELVAAGVKLRRGKSNCLLDITFKHGILEIPRLYFYADSESSFRNLIAFEQCYYRDDSYVVDYFNFLDHLVNTPGDAKLLIQKKIIENWLGSDDAAASVINSYCKNTFLYKRKAYFSRLRQDLVAHCGTRCHRWKASLKRDYFTTPWAAISVFAAIILLILTVTQTVCSIIQTK